MAQKKLSGNAKCPCGSGRKYKACCYRKAFHYLVEDDGTVRRSVPINEEVVALLKEQENKFLLKHGRAPGPDDHIFDREDIPDDETFKKEMKEAMHRAGIDPALIYAFQKTGVVLTEMNKHLMPTKDVEEFHAAVAEYHELHDEENEDFDA